MTVKTVDNPVMSDVARNMAKLLKARLLIGIPGGTTHPDSKVDNATLGYINEFGDDQLHIPPRPFLVPGVMSVKDKIADKMAAAAATVLAGGSVDAAKGPMMAAGLLGVDAVRTKMQEGPFTPLAASTVYARLHRKKKPRRNSDKPLIDSGELRTSVTSVIDDKG